MPDRRRQGLLLPGDDRLPARGGLLLPGHRALTVGHAVITGGCGFIGGHLAGYLARSGQEVTVFDAAPPAWPAPGDVRYVQGDIRDEDALAKAVTRGTDV